MFSNKEDSFWSLLVNCFPAKEKCELNDHEFLILISQLQPDDSMTAPIFKLQLKRKKEGNNTCLCILGEQSGCVLYWQAQEAASVWMHSAGVERLRVPPVAAKGR